MVGSTSDGLAIATGERTGAQLLEWKKETSKGGLQQRSSSRKLPVFHLDMFDVDEQIGQGSFAEVFSAEMTLPPTAGNARGEKRKVALKIVKEADDLGIGPDCEASYEDVLYAVRQEVKVAERIGRHPNVVQVLGSAEKGTVLVMELAKSDLSQVVRRARRAGRQVPLALIQTWAKDILAGVAHIHAAGVLHMDVKSGNVLIDKNGTAVLTDFGLAIQGSSTIEVDRELMTLWYRAPELLMGKDTINALVDSWGAGAVILEMMIGKPPFRGDPGTGCKCKSVLHENFNADQLAKIFDVVGSPKLSELGGCATAKHFASWEPYARTLEALVKEERPADTASEEGARSLTGMTELVDQLLQLHPGKRLMPGQALEMPLFTRRGSTSPASSTTSSSSKSSSTVSSAATMHHAAARPSHDLALRREDAIGGGDARVRSHSIECDAALPHADAAPEQHAHSTSPTTHRPHAEGAERGESPMGHSPVSPSSSSGASSSSSMTLDAPGQDSMRRRTSPDAGHARSESLETCSEDAPLTGPLQDSARPAANGSSALLMPTLARSTLQSPLCSPELSPAPSPAVLSLTPAPNPPPEPVALLLGVLTRVPLRGGDPHTLLRPADLPCLGAHPQRGIPGEGLPTRGARGPWQRAPPRGDTP